MKDKTVLITGCTSGIGYHLAHEFAANGSKLVLVAPDPGELENLRAELTTTYQVEARVIAKNLELEDAPREIDELLHLAGVQVDVLVNNAGHGFRGRFWENPQNVDDSMIDLNVRAPLRLTKLFLPRMIAGGSGHILNTASVAGFEPGPWMSVYHATKAFLLSWSEALAVELEDTGVQVTILCPGPTDTDFFPKADMEDVVAFQKAAVMAPQDVARAAYLGLVDGDRIIIPGAANKALVAARRILPERMQAKLNEKFYEEVPPEDRKRERGDFEKSTNL